MSETDEKGKCPLSPAARKFFVCLCICLLVAVIYFFTAGKQAKKMVEEPSSPAATEIVTFTDALGQELTMARPKRVVSLMGSFTEIWLLFSAISLFIFALSRVIFTGCFTQYAS